MDRLKLFLPLFIFGMLALLFWRGLSLDPRDMPSALLNKPVPSFSLPTLADPDKPVSNEALPSEPYLLNVWATWCPTCKAEHAYLNSLAEQGVNIVGINYKDETGKAQRWLQELDDPYVFSVIDAEGRLGIDLGVFGAPETYLVDRSGVIRCKHIGDVNDRVWTQKLAPVYEALVAGTLEALNNAASNPAAQHCR